MLQAAVIGASSPCYVAESEQAGHLQYERGFVRRRHVDEAVQGAIPRLYPRGSTRSCRGPRRGGRPQPCRNVRFCREPRYCR